MSDISSGISEHADIPAPSASEAGGSAILAASGEGADSLVGLPTIAEPAPVVSSGEVLLGIDAPWSTGNFDPSLSGCPVITKFGTPVLAQFVEQVISIGAANGVTIVKR